MSSESEKIRAERKRQRELKNERKEELSGATSASERRQIKAKYSEPRVNVNEVRSEGNSYDSMSGRTEQPMPPTLNLQLQNLRPTTFCILMLMAVRAVIRRH